MLLIWLVNCDTTSYFHQKGKKSFWSTWESFQELTPVLVNLTETPSEPNENDLKMLERFVALVYDNTTEHSEINGVRQKLRPVEHIPPTQVALKFHLHRSFLQARTCYQMDYKNIDILDSLYGFNKKNN